MKPEQKVAMMQVVRQSRLYESAPAYVTDQPRFVNGALVALTPLSPLELLDALKAVEVGYNPFRMLIPTNDDCYWSALNQCKHCAPPGIAKTACFQSLHGLPDTQICSVTALGAWLVLTMLLASHCNLSLQSKMIERHSIHIMHQLAVLLKVQT